MKRVIVICVLAASACGTQKAKDVPHDLEYVTETIFAPSCGTTNCHSEFTQAARAPKGDPDRDDDHDGIPDNYRPPTRLIFDTVENARATFQRDGDLMRNYNADDQEPALMLNLKQWTAGNPPEPQMPLDQPLPFFDREVIRLFLRDAAPGVCNTEKACSGTLLYYCNLENESFDFERGIQGPCEVDY